MAQGPEAERFIRACLMTHHARGLAHTVLEVLAKRPSLYSLDARLRELRVPTLLIVGEYDTPCLKVHRFLADVIPKAKHVVLRGAGHLTNLESPSAFNAAVTSFLRLRPSPRPRQSRMHQRGAGAPKWCKALGPRSRSAGRRKRRNQRDFATVRSSGTAIAIPWP